MFCPNCKTIELENTVFQETDVSFCPQCLGMWFEIDELAQAKDAKDKNLRWLDIDLWKDEKKFSIAKDQKVCPLCEVPLYAVEYGKSRIYPRTNPSDVRGDVDNVEAKPPIGSVLKNTKSIKRIGAGVKVDLCNLCQSIWLDRGEFAKILDYLKKESAEQILHHYAKNALEETAEMFWGPEDFSSEVKDFLTIIKMLNYKFVVQHPVISQLIAVLPK